MSVSESEFEWIDDPEVCPPGIELYQDVDDGVDVLVAHEHLNPFGWIASDTSMEVRQ